MKVVTKAPGKAMLFGEYAVLEGAPALVAALDCTAEASYVVEAADASPVSGIPGVSGVSGVSDVADVGDATSAEASWHCTAPHLGLSGTLVQREGTLIAAAPLAKQLTLAARVLAAAWQNYGVPPGRLQCDTAAFYHGPHKLGFGSSAALTVAATTALRAAALAAQQGSPSVADADAPALAELTQVHNVAQGGRGSGADVAAALLGGVVRYQLPNLPGSQGQTIVSATQLSVAPAAHLVFVYTGRSAATPPYLAAFADFKARMPRVYWARLEPLASLAAAACEIWQLGHTEALLPVVSAYAEAMGDLGECIGMPIVSPVHRKLAEIVGREGAAYKPSGAGGGDVGVAFCPSAKVAERVRRAVRKHNHVDLPTQVSPKGTQTHTTRLD